jgi:predicted ArsR family transcriptional regulator
MKYGLKQRGDLMAPIQPSDKTILDLLRTSHGLTISDFTKSLQVTATAVRQKLNRLLGQGFIRREVERTEGRGRPVHRYSLTELGSRRSGTNFADLAVAIWQEIRAIDDPQIRRGLLDRISRRLAEGYRPLISGSTSAERMRAVANIFGDREIPCEVTASPDNGLPVLNVLACPYPMLAEQDRGVCAMERLLFSELIGTTVRLAQCRLDGPPCCSFEA